MKRTARWWLIPVVVCSLQLLAAQQPTALPQADERYKADILVVVAHPDDEAAVTPYLARALDEHKRIAVVFCTRGSSGENQAGAEQASALGAVREIEARNALTTLGITNVWFLSGKDTASQNVLLSLANWDHGETLEETIRLVRLTRPEVILTFLPGTFIGEDHGDHQACGVLATEAFDLAGDPTMFPEQVAGPVKRLPLENLRPWQVKKIYYFPDADREDIFRGKGPSYSVKEVSKVTKEPYWRIAFNSFRAHQTQAKPFLDRIAQTDDAQVEKIATSEDWWGQEQHFVLGKSVVGGSVTGDIFEAITPGAIQFVRPEITPEPARPDLAVELGGPWSFYAEFRRVHGLTNLPHPEPPEIALQGPGTLVIPLWISSRTAKAQEVAISALLPSGWIAENGTGKFIVPTKQSAASRVEVNLPVPAEKPAEKAPSKAEPQEVTVRVEANGQVIGEVKLRVELRKRALPQ